MKRGWWKLTFEGVDELTDTDLEHISKLVLGGFTSGEILQEVEENPYEECFYNAAEELSLEVDRDYSGRGMYGRTCLAVRFGRDSYYDDADFKVSFRDFCKDAGLEKRDLYTDQMGLGIVVYLR